MYDKFREECGLIGIWNHEEAANMAYLGLYAQQHRGQEGAGVVSVSGSPGTFHRFKGIGLVSDVFDSCNFAEELPGDSAIGHVRYTTAGGGGLSNVQPFFSEVSVGPVALAHNGNLTNADILKTQLIKDGAIFNSTSDTEIILHLLARSEAGQPLVENVISSLKQVEGAYSLLFLFKDRLIGVRDPWGVRPLSLAKIDDGWAIASETCAFDLIGASYVREIAPGELVEIQTGKEPKSYFPFPRVPEAPCIFEYVYFARPDSLIFGRDVYSVRKKLGMELAKESPVEADIVVPVPDSGVAAAIGFSQELDIPVEMGLIRNHYVGRTFIEPQQSIRDFGVKIKHNPNRGVLQGKRIVVIDDSIVRGTTSRKLVNMLRDAGAKEVHMRISSPPTVDPCYYGIDTPEKKELIASNMSVDDIRQFVGVDTLAYLSLDGLYKAVGSQKGKFCDACFSGNYPLGKIKSSSQGQGELF